MNRWLSSLIVLFILGWTPASAQSLGEVAKKEKQRRKELRTQTETPDASDDEGGSEELSLRSSGAESHKSTQASDDEDQQGESAGDAGTRVGSEPPQSSRGVTVSASREGIPVKKQDEPASRRGGSSKELHLRGALYIDWFRTAHFEGLSSGQLSTRVKLEAGHRPGDGWRILLDLRDRQNTGNRTSNQLIIYDAYLMLDDRDSPFSLSFGQMNLYDSAGIGTLLGGRLGYRLGDSVTVGGYGGLQPDIYGFTVDPSYQKLGTFARYDGVDARSVTVSYNVVRFDGRTERQFLFTSGLIPMDQIVLYGNLEYELGSNISSDDRVSRLFLNARWNVSETIDVTGHYSSGKGLDYHRFLLEQSQSPGLSSAGLERFYYSSQYGARLGVRFHPKLRVFVEQRRSEQKDRLITNNTTRLGGSAHDIADSGFSFYGSYNINRGDASESNSFQFSLSRDFGRLSWTGYFSTSFNGIRFDAVSGRPVIVHIDDRRTISNDFFFVITRALALSLEYEYSAQGAESENTLFARGIYRF